MNTPSTTPPLGQRWFNQHAPTPFKSNQRLGVRFVRDDIAVSVRKSSLFSLGLTTKKDFPVNLVDISSRGILIASPIKLNISKKISLNLCFADQREFDIIGTVTRKQDGEGLFYGIKFDKVNNHFADYLIVSQKNLTFK
jgi:PilZ domain